MLVEKLEMILRYYKKSTHALRYWMLRQLPACRQMAPIMSDSLERKLSFRERVRLRFHLWVCIWCAWYLEHLQLMNESRRKRAAQISPPETSPPVVAAGDALSADACERLKRAVMRAEER